MSVSGAPQPKYVTELFESALRRALSDPEIVQQYANLRPGPDRRGELEAELRRNRDDILIDAAEELEHLRITLDRQDPSGDPDGDTEGGLATEIDKIRSSLADITAEQGRVIAQHNRMQSALENDRTAKEVLKSRIAAGLESDAPAARLSYRERVLSRLPVIRHRHVPETASEKLDFDYMLRLEDIQRVKKRALDVTTAKKRVQLQLDKLEQRMQREQRRRAEFASPGAAALSVGEARIETARESAIRALVEKGLLPRCRNWLNDQLARRQADARFRLDLEGATGDGLGEAQNPRYEVPTIAYARMARMLGRMKSGSIGVAGPRGAGKTTLLASVCGPGGTIAGTAPRAAFVVAAPVRYSPQEFVAHVLSKVCDELLPRDSVVDALAKGRAAALEERRRRARVVSRGVVAIGATCVVAGLALLAHHLGLDEMSRKTALVALAVTLATSGVLITLHTVVQISVPKRIRWAARRVGSLHLAVRWDMPVAGAALLVSALVIGEGSSRPIDGATAFALGSGFAVLTTLKLVPHLSRGADAARAGAFVIAGLLGISAAPMIALHAARPAIAASGLTVFGLVLSLGAWLSASRARQTAADPSALLAASEAEGRLISLAEYSRRRISYRQTVSADWTSRVASDKLPLAVERSVSGARSAEEELLTMPEVVELLRELLTAAAFERPVVVGIDELDKIGSIDDAQHFLNDIKAIFGAPGCYFLIAVSEDAVASFERRGMPLRDAFDSAFDDILRIEMFELEGTESLLGSRTVGMPMPFMALAHVLSGGLARDTLRIARRLFDPPEPASTTAIAELCRIVVRSELAAKRDGAVTAVRDLAPRADVAQILSWLGTASLTPTSSGLCAHLPLPTLPPGSFDPQASLAAGQLLQEFATYWYFAATVIEFFCAGRVELSCELRKAPTTLVPSNSSLELDRRSQ